MGVASLGVALVGLLVVAGAARPRAHHRAREGAPASHAIEALQADLEKFWSGPLTPAFALAPKHAWPTMPALSGRHAAGPSAVDSVEAGASAPSGGAAGSFAGQQRSLHHRMTTAANIKHQIIAHFRLRPIACRGEARQCGGYIKRGQGFRAGFNLIG